MLGHYLNLVLAETTIRYVRRINDISIIVKGLIVSPSGGEGGYCIDGSDYIPYGTFMS